MEQFEQTNEILPQNVAPLCDQGTVQSDSATPSVWISPSYEYYGTPVQLLNSLRPEEATNIQQFFSQQCIPSPDADMKQQNQEQEQYDHVSMLAQLPEQNLYQYGQQISQFPHVLPGPTNCMFYPDYLLEANNSIYPSHRMLPRMPPTFSLPQQQQSRTHKSKISSDRKLCCEQGCTNQSRVFGRCKRHGGSKRCSSPNCENSVQSRGLCIRHGGGSRCKESGCTRASQSKGRCKLHGGGTQCTAVGCAKRAHFKRLCRKHGGGVKCCIAGCEKWAQRQRMCLKHVKELIPSET